MRFILVILISMIPKLWGGGDDRPALETLQALAQNPAVLRYRVYFHQDGCELALPLPTYVSIKVGILLHQ